MVVGLPKVVQISFASTFRNFISYAPVYMLLAYTEIGITEPCCCCDTPRAAR